MGVGELVWLVVYLLDVESRLSMYNCWFSLVWTTTPIGPRSQSAHIRYLIQRSTE